MNDIKQKLVSAKNKIQKHQTAILTTGLVITTTAAAIMIRSKMLTDEFLEEKGLTEEYYAPEVEA